jgi:hypothetical protein
MHNASDFGYSIAGQLPAASDRTTRFLARIDVHLATLPESKRAAFLRQQVAGWEMRYEQFQLTDGRSEPVTDAANPPQAADFVLTIEGLDARLRALDSALVA